MKKGGGQWGGGGGYSVYRKGYRLWPDCRGAVVVARKNC